MKINKLNEGLSDLYQGIFWIVNEDSLEENKPYCLLIPSTSEGKILDDNNLNAKSGITYNHEKTWKLLPKQLTQNKPFNYYPRGRVQINNNKAVVYLSPWIYTEEIMDFIKREFHLTPNNGIKKIIFNADGSEHYKCYLDEGDD